MKMIDEVELKAKIKQLQQEQKQLQKELKHLNLKISNQENENSLASFEHKLQKNDKMCLFYTRFVYAQIVLLLNFVSCENMKYCILQYKNLY